MMRRAPARTRIRSCQRQAAEVAVNTSCLRNRPSRDTPDGDRDRLKRCQTAPLLDRYRPFWRGGSLSIAGLPALRYRSLCGASVSASFAEIPLIDSLWEIPQNSQVPRGLLNHDEPLRAAHAARAQNNRYGRAGHFGFSETKAKPDAVRKCRNICCSAPRLGLWRIMRSKSEIISHLAVRATCAVAAGQPGARRTD
jgi:hypothetical protein